MQTGSAYQMGLLVGTLVGLAIGSAIISLIGAFILKVAANWAEGLDLDYGDAFGTVFFSYLINSGLGFTTGAAFGTGDQQKDLPMNIILLGASFLVQASMISLRHEMSFLRGAKVSLFMYLVSLVIVIVFVGVILVVKVGLKGAAG